jgi:uncharacterized membrane protein YheB (UPF0754 family)
MHKSLLTHSIAVLFLGISFVLPETYGKPLLYMSIFALSGAVTNQLAIHMLFEKIPFLVGSGVIEKNFERFKQGLHTMIMEHFFTEEKVTYFFKEQGSLTLAPMVDKLDFRMAFDALSQTVMESKFGSAIQMFGGVEALESMREPFENKLRSTLESMVTSTTFQKALEQTMSQGEGSENLHNQLETLIVTTLNELTPQMVKKLVYQLIQEHLGWLVVWGGVFGGVIGLLSSFMF